MTERTFVNVPEDAAMFVIGFMIALLVGTAYFIDPVGMFEDGLGLMTRSTFAAAAGVAFFIGWVWPRHGFVVVAIAMAILAATAASAAWLGHGLGMAALAPLFWIIGPGGVPLIIEWALRKFGLTENLQFAGE